MTFGEKLYQLRKQRGLSQEELADCLDVSRQAVSKWEVGEALPDTKNIVQLSKLFKKSIDYLLDDDINEISVESDLSLDNTHDMAKSTEEIVPKQNHRKKTNMPTVIGAIVTFFGLLGLLIVCVLLALASGSSGFSILIAPLLIFFVFSCAMTITGAILIFVGIKKIKNK